MAEVAERRGMPACSILVVDDEENLNWSLVTSLRRDNYLADGALSGEEALHRLGQRRYDFVISDVKMPGMDGFELLEYLHRHHPTTRVLMMTAFGSPTARQEAFRGGVVAFLEKPFDLRALKAELRRLASATAGQGGGTYDVLDVAQVINLTRRDLTLVISNSDLHGELRFEHGELVWAGAETLRGDAAFYALAVPRALSAEPQARGGGSERNITQPLSRLIFQALTARTRGATTPVAPTDHLFEPAGAMPADQGDGPIATPPPARPATGAPAPTTGYATHPPTVPALAHTPATLASPPPRAEAPATWSTSSAWAVSSLTSLRGTAGQQPEASTALEVEGADARAEDQPTVPHIAVGIAPQAHPLAQGTTPTTVNVGSTLVNDERQARVTSVLARIVEAAGGECGVVITAADGHVLARADEAFAAPVDGVYAHLAAAAQSAARALLLADWGSLEEARLLTPRAFIIASRLSVGDGASLCVLATRREDESRNQRDEAAVAALREHLPEIIAALR